MKNINLNKWLWKWHVIAGLFTLPFVLILSITGGIYLFKDNYEVISQKSQREVVKEEQRLSYQEQWGKATLQTTESLHSMVVPRHDGEATKFVSGKFAGKSTLYLNPNTGVATGKIAEKSTDMFKVRKLHGELLMGSWGTKVVELVASWLVVLLLTGLYIWWPRGPLRWKGFFLIRIKEGRRTFFRDFHAVVAIWFSSLLLMILLGGLPWTDVFGDSFKWVQQVTNTGYPGTWGGRHLSSAVSGEPLKLDVMVAKAGNLDLKGEVAVTFPKSKTGVYSVSNTSGDPRFMEIHHFDQYSGKELLSQNWNDIGILMKGRLWFMAFHQGQFGPWNKWLMLFAAIMLFSLSIGAIFSYVLRSKKGWGIPKVPASFKVGKGVLPLVLILSIVFPLFGLSVVLIVLSDFIRKRTFKGVNSK